MDSTQLLASIIQGEAATPADQFGVASVIQNRVNQGFAGSSGGALGVATAPGQFSAYPSALQTPNSNALGLATALQNGTLSQYGSTGNATYYNAAGYAYQNQGNNAYSPTSNVYSDQFGQQPSANFQLPQLNGTQTASASGNLQPYGSIAEVPYGAVNGGDGSNIAPQTYGQNASPSDFGTPSTLFGSPAGSGYANPSQPMQSVPGTSNSSAYMSSTPAFSDVYTLGVPEQIKAASTAASAASASSDAQNASDTATISGTFASGVNAAIGAGTSWLVRGGILLFGLVFLAGGVYFFSRQEA